MIIAFAGASGSGKTTLAKRLAKDLGWFFQENSAGLITSERDKGAMANMWDYRGNLGQKDVINKSHAEPPFGLYFQESILRARKELLFKNKDKNCIYDRSPLDPIVFYLNQCVHNFDEVLGDHFMKACTAAMIGVDIIIKIPLQNPDHIIEDNGSRVANWWFQQKIDKLFDLALNIVQANTQELGINHPIHCYKLDQWNFESRLTSVRKIIESNKELVLR